MADVYEVPPTNNNDDNVDEYDSETIDEEMLDEIMLDLHDNEIIQNILSPTNDLEGQVNEALGCGYAVIDSFKTESGLVMVMGLYRSRTA